MAENIVKGYYNDTCSFFSSPRPRKMQVRVTFCKILFIDTLHRNDYLIRSFQPNNFL